MSLTPPPRRPRLPGNRTIRRRQHAKHVITVSDLAPRREIPNVRTHAQRFAVAFVALVLIGAFLLSLPITTESGESTPWIDALFTSTSAAAVTGLVSVETQDHWNFFGELVVLLLIQAGGLGFMVGASLLLASLRRGASLRDSLMLQDGSPTLTLREASSLSRRILRFTFVTEGIGAALLTIRFLQDESPLVALWYGIFHAVSAFCNAGFDLMGGYRSLTEYNSSVWVNAVIVGLVQAGALSYLVLSDTWVNRSWRKLSLDTKLVLTTNLALLVAGTAMFLSIEWSSALRETPDWAKPMAALFQSGVVRTAGFATVSFEDVAAPTVFLWTGLMMVGGASGSTAGGIKLATAAIIFIAVLSTIRGRSEPQAFERRISSQLVFRAMTIIALFMSTHFMLTLLLALSEHVIHDSDIAFLPMMFETMSAMATVGLSTGITPELSTLSKGILCVAMIFGRLGPLTAVYALQRRSRPSRYRYPESSIRLG